MTELAEPSEKELIVTEPIGVNAPDTVLSAPRLNVYAKLNGLAGKPNP